MEEMVKFKYLGVTQVTREKENTGDAGKVVEEKDDI